MGFLGHSGDMEPTSNRAPVLLYVAMLLSLLVLAAVIAASTPQPDGACSGIGFGCSLYGWDLAGFLLMIVGLPYAVAVGAVLAILGLLRWWRAATAVAGLACVAPWVLVLVALSST